ncbi:MAG: hypothetical protein KKF44_08830 [Nanoarchaeota archaeon]|nr:hypothetical protein [Nanoarchaeota archaeon]
MSLMPIYDDPSYCVDLHTHILAANSTVSYDPYHPRAEKNTGDSALDLIHQAQNTGTKVIATTDYNHIKESYMGVLGHPEHVVGYHEIFGKPKAERDTLMDKRIVALAGLEVMANPDMHLLAYFPNYTGTDAGPQISENLQTILDRLEDQRDKELDFYLDKLNERGYEFEKDEILKQPERGPAGINNFYYLFQERYPEDWPESCDRNTLYEKILNPIGVEWRLSGEYEQIISIATINEFAEAVHESGGVWGYAHCLSMGLSQSEFSVLLDITRPDLVELYYPTEILRQTHGAAPKKVVATIQSYEMAVEALKPVYEVLITGGSDYCPYYSYPLPLTGKKSIESGMKWQDFWIFMDKVEERIGKR